MRAEEEKLARLLAAIEADRTAGSIELAHRSIMALFRARRNAERPDALDALWLRWARRARPEMKVFRKLAAHSRNPVRASWARKKSLAFWLITVLHNSVSQSLHKAQALISPGARVFIFGASWQILHLLLLVKSRRPLVLAPGDPRSRRTLRLLKREGLPTLRVHLDGPWTADLMLTSCDAYDASGNFVNALGTARAIQACFKRRIPVRCIATWLKKSDRKLSAPRDKGFELVRRDPRIRFVGDLP